MTLRGHLTNQGKLNMQKYSKTSYNTVQIKKAEENYKFVRFLRSQAEGGRGRSGTFGITIDKFKITFSGNCVREAVGDKETGNEYFVELFFDQEKMLLGFKFHKNKKPNVDCYKLVQTSDRQHFISCTTFIKNNPFVKPYTNKFFAVPEKKYINNEIGELSIIKLYLPKGLLIS